MKHLALGLAALVFATSAWAETGQGVPPAAEPAETSKPAPPADSATPTAPAHAGKAKMHVGGRAKAYEMPRKAYAKTLAAEIRRHTPKIASQESGVVTVAFTVGASGRVVSHTVKHASNPALVAAVGKILSSIQTPPPPGGSFTAEQEFRFR
ncbi:TonB C-terminal domain-containing protein [Methylocystis heyeri]|nr:TonB C-terminal domain-containing protein [Methylocystis heyeri]